MVIFTDPAWSAAIATWGLFIVTVIAASVGLYAALSAARTYELESQPVILVRQLERDERVANADPAHLSQHFTVSGRPTLSDGIELRSPFPNEAGYPNVSMEDQMTVLEIQNLGRSPALDVQLPFAVSAFYSSRKDDRTRQGSGNIVLGGIAPNATIYVRVDSLIGAQVTLKAADFGTYTRVDGAKKRRRPLAIISLKEIHIPRYS